MDNHCVMCGAYLADTSRTVCEKCDKPLGMILSPYEQGEWDMFSLLTSVSYGKQCYFLEKNGMVYSRVSHEYMTREQAYEEYLKGWGGV